MRDALLTLASSQAFTASAVFAGVIDLESLSPARRVGSGEPMCLNLQVAVAADYTTANETYTARILQSDNEDLSSPDVIESRLISYADLTAGAIQTLGLPPGTPTKRYLGADMVLAGTTPTITLSADFRPQSMVESRQSYATGSVML